MRNYSKKAMTMRWTKENHEDNQFHDVASVSHSLQLYPYTPIPMKGGNKTTTHNTASKWLRDDHTQQCKKWLKEDDNNDMNLFTWQKDHENDQPNDIVKALHSLWLHPCTPKPHESGVGGIKAQCTTMQVND